MALLASRVPPALDIKTKLFGFNLVKNSIDSLSGIPYTIQMLVRVLRTASFTKWYLSVDSQTRLHVDARIERIVAEGHFGTVRRFEGITELKWGSGLRVYTAERRPNLILLLGGNKNGQDKDIRQSKKLLGEID